MFKKTPRIGNLFSFERANYQLVLIHFCFVNSSVLYAAQRGRNISQTRYEQVCTGDSDTAATALKNFVQCSKLIASKAKINQLLLSNGSVPKKLRSEEKDFKNLLDLLDGEITLFFSLHCSFHSQSIMIREDATMTLNFTIEVYNE